MRRCHVCGLELADGRVHRFDRDCVNALRLELQRVRTLQVLAQRAIACEPDY